MLNEMSSEVKIGVRAELLLASNEFQELANKVGHGTLSLEDCLKKAKSISDNMRLQLIKWNFNTNGNR